MKIYFAHTHAKNGGFGILGKGIRTALSKMPDVEIVNDENCNFPPLQNRSGYKRIPKVDIILTYGMPDLFEYAQALKKAQRGKPVHVHYFVWESSQLPKDFVKIYKQADYLLTATKYTAEMAAKQGLKADVWHHGIDERFAFQPRLDDGVYTFLHHNAYEYRKNWDIVLLAFMNEFSIDEPVRLVFKGRERKGGAWIMPEMPKLNEQSVKIYREDRKEYFRTFAKIDHPLIDEVLGHISDEEMVALNQKADCFVFPAKGEGWGLPPFEAAAMGIVPIVSQFGAFSEWVDKRYMIALKPNGFLNTSPRYPGYMHAVGVQQVRRAMRKAFNEQDKQKKQAKAMSESIHEKYNWGRIGRDLVNYLNAYFYQSKGKLP